MFYKITPVAKPRMTQRDKWAKRDCVQRYWDFKQQCRDAGLKYTPSDAIVFILPMPKSWSAKKKAAMNEELHTQKPDIDNLCKATLDALYDDDAAFHTIIARKQWGYEGAILVLENRAEWCF